MNFENLVPAKIICELYNIKVSLIQSFFDSGLIRIIILDDNIFLLKDEITRIEHFVYLYNELEINLSGLEVIAHLVPKIENLQSEIIELKNQLYFYKQSSINAVLLEEL